MFTGIIEELGTCIVRDNVETSVRLLFSAAKTLDDLKVDDSISVNGVCLTVVGLEPSSFEVIAVAETLEKTTLGSLKFGNRVNLERAVTLQTRLGGHLVQGHIDGVAKIVNISNSGGGSWEFSFELPDKFLRYIIAQGSIAINGVSLTIAGIEGNVIKTAIIPHTFEATNFQYLCIGDFVNFEVDCLQKMVERLLLTGTKADK